MNLRTRVQKYIQARALLRPGEGLVLGVSGGPDSLCLLDVLHALAADWELTLHVAHLNHGLRPEAPAEAGFVRAQTEARGLALTTETVDARAYALAHKKSIEEAARELRYAFLARTAQAVGAHAIAVAHTADDQAETVLMHFLRGSGLAGLRGMLPKVDIRDWNLEAGSSHLSPPATDLQPLPPNLCLIRPLLTATRAEVEAYCAERGLRPVQDATNLDTTYFRNRLRHELLPHLEAYNPNIRAVIRRMAEVMAGEHELLRSAVEALWARTARAGDGQVTFERGLWLGLTVPEQRMLLREAVSRLRPERRNVDFTPLEQAVQFARAAVPGRSCDLLGGLRLSISHTHITVCPWDDTRPGSQDMPLVNTQGQLAPGWRFCMDALGPGEWSRDEVRSHASDWRVYVDAAPIRAPLRVRARLPGDRFHPLGMHGHRLKVSDFMINAKVEESLRHRWPMVVSGDDIVWVAGLRLDERFKVTPATERVMRLWFVREDEVRSAKS